MVDTGRLKTGCVENRNDIPRRGAFEILISLGGAIVEKAVGRIGQKSQRFDLRVHCLNEYIIKREPEDK